MHIPVPGSVALARLRPAVAGAFRFRLQGQTSQGPVPCEDLRAHNFGDLDLV